MDYKKKYLKNTNQNESYEEIDTRLASGWYVNEAGLNKKKKYKTQQVTFKLVKKNNQLYKIILILRENLFIK